MKQQSQIWTNGTWAIDEFFNDNTGKFSLMVYSDECAVVDYPIRYGKYHYGFDWADRVPERIRTIVKRILESDEKYQPDFDVKNQMP